MLNPYDKIKEMQSFKGDLHIHTNRSDGIASPQDMYAKLRECKFNFCCLADHDLPGDTPHFEDSLLALCGQELSDDNGHIVALSSEINRKQYDTISGQLIAVRESGGFSILNHPKIREFVSDQSPTYTASRLVNELAGLFGGIEVYTHNVGSGFKLAIDRLDVVWTSMLNQQIKPEDFKPVWAFGSSDSHATRHITPNVGIMVWADDLNEKSIMNSIRKGSFYSLANSKSRFKKIELRGNILRVVSDDAIMIRMIKRAALPVSVVSSNETGELELVYHINGDEGYLRIEAMDDQGNCAYSNPILIGSCDD